MIHEEPYTIAEACEALEELANDCEAENYHSEAAVICNDVMPVVQNLKERCLVVVTGIDEAHIMTVQP